MSTTRCALGEGPLWHPITNCLYVTDIFSGEVLMLDCKLHRQDTLELKRVTTALTWQLDGSLLFFHDRCAVTRVAANGDSELLLAGLPDEEGGLFNDVIADSTGRVLCGAQPVGNRPGRLYSIEPDLTWRILLDDVLEPNGMGFSPDGRTLYFTDTGARTIWKFEYDSRSGSLGRREIFFALEGESLPDGLTVDVCGRVWSAQWQGGAVLCIDPAGRVVRSVSLPTARITAVAFGDAEFGTLYVTSASDGANGSSHPASSYDGAIFALRGCAHGRAEHPSRLGC